MDFQDGSSTRIGIAPTSQVETENPLMDERGAFPQEEWKMSIIDLFRPASTSALRAPQDHEATSIVMALRHLQSPVLATISDGELRCMMDEAIADGGGILIIGMAPTDIEIQGDRFAAQCLVRLTASPTRLDVRIEGSVDAIGRVAPDAARLCGASLPIAA
jgi:hypothetical protein